jgi:hypothetical protein
MSAADALMALAQAAKEERQKPEAARKDKLKQLQAKAAAGDGFAQMQLQARARDEQEHHQRWGAPRRSPAAYNPSWMGKTMLVVGRVSGVGCEGAVSSWVTRAVMKGRTLNCRIVVCSPYPDMFQDQVGAGLSAMVGKTLQAAGPVEKPLCGNNVPKATILVNQSDDWKTD